MAFQRQRFEQLRTNCYSSSFATLCERGGTQRHRQRDPMANAPSILYFGAISSAAPSKAAEELVPAATLERRVGSEEDALPSARAARGEAPKRRAHWDRTRLHEDRWLAWQLRQETKLFEPPQSMQSMRRVGHGGRGGAAFLSQPLNEPAGSRLAPPKLSRFAFPASLDPQVASSVCSMPDILSLVKEF